LRIILTTFGVVFLAELPDKTALATLLLAARYRPRPVIAGAWLAFLIQTVVAVAAGGLLHLLPERWVRVAAGAGFLAFAVVAWRRREEVGRAEQASTHGPERPVWMKSFVVIFLAEWGDLTQLATAALAARERDPLAVGVGALGALWAVCILAAGLGSQAGRFLDERTLTRLSAVVFAAIGAVTLAAALR
jgi:putative Ca2+/H+ antiporter (TMEM165/GDT1 family)